MMILFTVVLLLFISKSIAAY